MVCASAKYSLRHIWFSIYKTKVNTCFWTRSRPNASLYTIWWCIVHGHWHFLRMSFWLSLSALENDVSAAVELRTKPYCSCSTHYLKPLKVGLPKGVSQKSTLIHQGGRGSLSVHVDQNLKKSSYFSYFRKYFIPLCFYPPFFHADKEGGGYVKCPRLSTPGGGGSKLVHIVVE